MRTITVKGTGSASAKPDYIVISFQLTAQDKDYEKMMRLASEQTNSIQTALARFGFETEDIKTAGFNVHTVYESVRDKNNNYQQVFKGYSCLQNMKLSFDFDSRRLSGALSAIASTAADPQLSVSFTVKNTHDISDAVLRDAAQNARRKAEILCEASGARLGKLLDVNYNWSEINVYSSTRYSVDYACDELCAVDECFDSDITPEEIKVRDDATFIWEIC